MSESPAQTTPPPPIPRRHPSRLSLSHPPSSSGASIDSESPTHPTSSPRRPRASRPPSAIYIGDEPQSHAEEHPHHNRMPAGFASTKVGLGSPSIDFVRHAWSGSGSATSFKRESSVEPEGYRLEEETPVRDHRANGLVDRVSGLPSPPRTDSDIALPPANGAKAEPDRYSSLLNESPPTMASSPPDFPSPRRTSSSSLIRPKPMQRTTSIASSTSTHSSLAPKKLLRPKQAGMSRSSSSSSTLATGNQPPIPRRLSTDLVRQPSVSSQQSPRRRSTVFAPSTNSASPSSHTSSRSRSNSPHKKSPSMPSSTAFAPRSPDKRNNKRLSVSSLLDEPIAEDRVSSSRKTSSSGNSLDERIRQAEESVRASQRRPRTGTAESESPNRGTIRRHDSYSRVSTQGSPGVGDPATLRRSATLSSALGRAGDGRTPDRGEYSAEPGSGGSGGSTGRRKPLPTEFRNSGGLFTPSPKPSASAYYTHAAEPPLSARSSRLQQFDSPTSHGENASSRFATTSRFEGLSSPTSAPRPWRQSIDGLERSSSSGIANGYTRRQWTESISGLPQAPRDRDLDYRGLPMPARRAEERHRAESVLDTASEQRRYSALARSSRLNLGLGPADSVSAVGARSEAPLSASKDPLEMIRKIEQSRAEHNRQWEADRAASVLGDAGLTRSASRYSHELPAGRGGSRLSAELITPSRVRPATSMSNMREYGAAPAPRTAPVERYRRPYDDVTGLERSGSRLSGGVGGSEPRPMRSSTSLGSGGRVGSPAAMLDSHRASTEHGRLLFAAHGALVQKMPLDRDLLASLASASRSSEAVSSALRQAFQLLAEDSGRDRRGAPVGELALLLRDASRGADQNVRELTRVMLDLPKALSAGTSVSGEPKRWTPRSPLDSIRRSEEMIRPSTSFGEGLYGSPTSSIGGARRSRESLPPGVGAGDGPSKGRMSSIVSRVRNLGHSPSSTKTDSPVGLGLNTIKASPPIPQTGSQSSSPTRSQHSRFPSAPEAQQQTQITPQRPRNTLRKKASAASTTTVRGSSFFPSSSKPVPAAITTVNAGTISPDLATARSIRSFRSVERGPEEDSPRSTRISFHTADEGGSGSSSWKDRVSGEYGSSMAEVGEGSGSADVVGMLEWRLAEAARAREEGTSIAASGEERTNGGLWAGAKGREPGSEGKGKHGEAVLAAQPPLDRKGSVSERFRATLRMGRAGA